MPDALAEVLLVDRDPAIGHEVVSYLSDRQYDVEWVDDSEKAYNYLDSRLLDVLVTELTRRHTEGMDLMSHARDRNPSVCVIMITDDPDVDLATEAMRKGAYDFQTRPVNMAKLEAVIQRGLGYQKLVYEGQQLRRRIDERFGFSNIIGCTRPTLQLCSQLRQAAAQSVPIVLIGESGTGRDLCAQAAHNASPRANGPFVRVDCEGASPSYLEHALFGRGPVLFGSPAARTRWNLESADQGTLYLDGASTLGNQIQDKIIRLLETGAYESPQDGHTRYTSVRLIVSLHPSDLEGQETGQFIETLDRLFGAALIGLPPLRERVEDIPLLAAHFASEASAAQGKNVADLTRSALHVLMRFAWPGNVRELRTVVSAMVLGARPGSPLGLMDLPSFVRDAASPAPGEIRIPPGICMSDVERIVIEKTLDDCGGNKELCAQTLGIGLRTLYRKLKGYTR